jgi:uncharacterized protein YbjQ (UPF0145 family)
MESPFQPDNSPSPFQGAYEPQHYPGASASSIRPFNALDITPPPRAAEGPSGAPLGPGVSPFLDNYQNPFAPKEDFSPVPMPIRPTLAPAPQPAAEPPRPPVPQSAETAAARASQIIATTDFPLPGSGSSFKPGFFLSTTAAVDGFSVAAYLGVVSVEIVIPKDLLFRNPAPYGELHRLKSAEDQLQKVKEKAMEELSERAQQMQADGVVGITLQYSALDNVVCLCSAAGTAVKLAG